MTKKWLIIWIITYLIGIAVIFLIFYMKDQNTKSIIQNQLSWSINFTWIVFPWENWNLTGDIEPINTWNDTSLTDYENYKNLLISNKFIRKFNPPKQPIINSSMNYEEKSQILNDYLKDNNFYFRNAQKLKNWYLYIKLNKEIINWWDTFLYFHDTTLNWYTVSWKLRKDKNLINSSKEFLYKLDSISINQYYNNTLLEYDWLSNELNTTNKLHYIGWYTTTSDWNYIEEIIIVWE